MAEKTYGTSQILTPEIRDYGAELHGLVGVSFPVSFRTLDGKLVGFTYDNEWREGSTEGYETGEQTEDGRPVIAYKENYTDHKLTKAQVAKVEAWAKENVQA